MNFIFFSPHFPQNSTEFCFFLKQNGANVLGIGDVEFESLNNRLKYSLTEYFKVLNMEDYAEVLKAVGYFTYKYGKINRFESLNEYWLELEARIRTDFNIYGTKMDFIYNLKHKSKMKAFFDKSGVQTVRYLQCLDKESALEFIEKVGFPVVVKPDLGSGASMTHKIENELEFDNFHHNKQVDISFIIEEYVDGVILTYDGLVDKYGNIAFETGHLFEQSIMEVVNSNDHLYYICLPEIDERVRDAGRRILKAFDVREKFFHIELFERRSDKNIIALEVNMRPPGAWMTDAINFTHEINIYNEWASMVTYNKVVGPVSGKYFTGYASRKNHKSYKHSHEEILNTYSDIIVNFNHIDEVFSRAMGDLAYQFRTKTYKEVKEIIEYIHEEL